MTLPRLITATTFAGVLASACGTSEGTETASDTDVGESSSAPATMTDAATTDAATTDTATTDAATTDADSTSEADSSTGDAPSGVETEHGGVPLAEWMKLYWTWNLGGDQEDRHMDLMFLPLPDSTDPDMDMVLAGEIDVELAAADGFVLPMFVWNGETYENGDPPDDDKGFPAEEAFTGMDIVVTLDDEIIIDSATDDLGAFYWDAIDFDEPIVYPMPTDYGAVSAIWVKGVGFLHTPLAPGEHVLHLEEFNEELMVGFSNTWNITVP